MTSYNLKPIILPSIAAREAKEQRRKLLEEVSKRRVAIAKERREKERSSYQANAEHREYQDSLREEAKKY